MEKVPVAGCLDGAVDHTGKGDRFRFGQAVIALLLKHFFHRAHDETPRIRHPEISNCSGLINAWRNISANVQSKKARLDPGLFVEKLSIRTRALPLCRSLDPGMGEDK